MLAVARGAGPLVGLEISAASANGAMRRSNLMLPRQILNEWQTCHCNPPSTPGILFDDVVDSRWTLTTIGAALRQAGSGPIYPLALATATPN